MPLPEFDIAGRQAVVIGGSRGIGKGIVLALAESGADVAVVSQNIANAEATAKRAAVLGVKAEAFAADATSLSEVEAMAGHVLSAFPDLSIVVNCVGDSLRGSVAEMPDGREQSMDAERWRWIVDINLTTIFNGSHAFGPHLLGRNGGSLINVSGIRGIRGAAFTPAYSAAKAAAIRFTEATALEWAPYGVRVNTISPGTFPDFEQMTPEEQGRRRQQPTSVPLGRPGELRDVGMMAVFLASDAAGYVTGANFVVDGGGSLV